VATPRYRSRQTLAAAVGGPLSFALAAGVGGRRVSGYRHRDEPVSALAARSSTAGSLMVGGFSALGLGTLLLARRLRGGLVPPPVPSMMAVAGVSTLAAGLARCSDRSCPSRFTGDAGATLVDEIHGATSMVTFILWVAMPLTAAGRGSALRAVDRRRSLSLGLLALACWCVTAVRLRRGEQQGLGAWQRAMIAAALSWYPVAAVASGR
jgi:hypothetical protein